MGHVKRCRKASTTVPQRPASSLLNRTGVLPGHVKQSLLRAGADNPLSSYLQPDISRYAALTRLVSNAPCSIWVQVVAIAIEALHVFVESRRALVGYRVGRGSQGYGGYHRRKYRSNDSFHFRPPRVLLSLLPTRSHSPLTQIVELSLHIRAPAGIATGSGTY